MGVAGFNLGLSLEDKFSELPSALSIRANSVSLFL
jgi:hypothetical protein